MDEIADWLNRLGMPEYAERFAENEIDLSALPHLTDQDLKDIGVLLGHRRKMLAAIGQPGGRYPGGARTCRLHRPEAAGYCRATASNGHVLRSGRIDSA